MRFVGAAAAPEAAVTESMRMVGTRVVAVKVDGDRATVTEAPEPTGVPKRPLMLVRERGEWKFERAAAGGGSRAYFSCVVDYQEQLDEDPGWKVVSHATIDEYTRRYCALRDARPELDHAAAYRKVWFNMCLEGKLRRRLGQNGFSAPSAPDTLAGEV